MRATFLSCSSVKFVRTGQAVYFSALQIKHPSSATKSTANAVQPSGSDHSNHSAQCTALWCSSIHCTAMHDHSAVKCIASALHTRSAAQSHLVFADDLNHSTQCTGKIMQCNQENCQCTAQSQCSSEPPWVRLGLSRCRPTVCLQSAINFNPQILNALEFFRFQNTNKHFSNILIITTSCLTVCLQSAINFNPQTLIAFKF